METLSPGVDPLVMSAKNRSEVLVARREGTRRQGTPVLPRVTATRLRATLRWPAGLAMGRQAATNKAGMLLIRKDIHIYIGARTQGERGLEPLSPLPVDVVDVTVTTGNVTVTSPVEGIFQWQAGMSKLMSDVRSYVPLQGSNCNERRRFGNEETKKSGKHPWHPGMYKGMSSLAGYVDRRGREYRDI